MKKRIIAAAAVLVLAGLAVAAEHDSMRLEPSGLYPGPGVSGEVNPRSNLRFFKKYDMFMK